MPDRKQTFQQIKEKQPNMDHVVFQRFVPEAKDLIIQMLKKDPMDRIKPEEALLHPYFVKTGRAPQPIPKQLPAIPESQQINNAESSNHGETVLREENE